MKWKGVSSLAAVTLLSFLLATCGLFRTGKQYWDDDHGPLVPHKTFPSDCVLCHLPDGWTSIRKDFTFDHKEKTGHALTGAHKNAACLRCHNDHGPVAMYVARGCVGCHLDPHRTSLGNDCLRCHTESTWRATGLVAEHANTRFPLVGRHVATACILCHPASATGDFRGAPTQCDQCHQASLAVALNPDHRAQGWVSRCDRCHTSVAWSGSGFKHSFFPLTGAHATARCESCHENGQFGPLPRDCLSCHQDDHARAPNHQSFGTQCQQCHGTSTWKGATFNHRFPITGNHRVDCSVCHVGGDTRTFTCLVCHDHSKTRMDDKHSETPGYSYSSASCLRCHPTGRD